MLGITSVVENPTIQCNINTLIVYVRISPRNRIKKKNGFSQKSNFKTNRKKSKSRISLLIYLRLFVNYFSNHTKKKYIYIIIQQFLCIQIKNIELIQSWIPKLPSIVHLRARNLLYDSVILGYDIFLLWHRDASVLKGIIHFPE